MGSAFCPFRCCGSRGFARGFTIVQCIVFAVAAILSATTCGTLGIVLVYITYFFKAGSAFFFNQPCICCLIKEMCSIAFCALQEKPHASGQSLHLNEGLLLQLVYEYQLARRREETLGDWAWNRFNVAFTLFLLFLLTVCLNFPSLLMWVKNIRYDNFRFFCSSVNGNFRVLACL